MKYQQKRKSQSRQKRYLYNYGFKQAFSQKNISKIYEYNLNPQNPNNQRKRLILISFQTFIQQRIGRRSKYQ